MKLYSIITILCSMTSIIFISWTDWHYLPSKSPLRIPLPSLIPELERHMNSALIMGSSNLMTSLNCLIRERYSEAMILDIWTLSPAPLLSALLMEIKVSLNIEVILSKCLPKNAASWRLLILSSGVNFLPRKNLPHSAKR